jgi:lysophospholipase L1-like esterase
VTCTVTDQIGRTNACAFAVSVTVPPKLAVTRFLAFGDSITWGEDGIIAASIKLAATFRPHVQLPTPQTYPGALQSDLIARYTTQSPQVTNAGNPGEAVTGSSTFPRYVGYTSSRAYDVVLLMEGSNDVGDQRFSAITSALGQMIDDAHSRGMQVMLATIPPQNPNGTDTAKRQMQAPLIAPLNDQIRGLAASKRIPLVDVYDAFGGDLSLLGADGLHPNAAGYSRIADTFFTAIKQNLEVSSAIVVTGAAPARKTVGARR